MASNKTKKTSNDNKKMEQTKKDIQSGVFYEVAILITIALCVLLFLANFGIIGVVGNAMSRFMFGVFGFLAYIMPLVIMPLVVFRLYVARSKHKSKRISKIKLEVYKNRRKKAFFVILGLICTAILGELIVNSYTPDTSFMAYFLNSRETGTGGGFIAGIFVNILVPLIGLIGTYFVVAIMLVICSIFISGKPILSLLGSNGKKVYDKTRGFNNQYELEEDESDTRLAQKADGIIPPSRNVMANIFGTKKKSKKADVVELIPEAFDGLDYADEFGDRDALSSNDEGKNRSLFNEIDLSKGESQFNTSTPNISIPGEASVEKPRRLDPRLMEVNSVDGMPTGHNPLEIAPVEINPSDFLSNRDASKDSVVIDTAKIESDLSQNMAEDGNLKKRQLSTYRKPSLGLLGKVKKSGGDSEAHLLATARRLEEILMNFGVHVKVINASRGPSVTRYELQPEQGVKVSKIVGLADDIKLNLAVSDLRIEAPIPGKAAVGIEVPNKENTPVLLRELLESDEFVNSPSNLSFAVGKDIAGKVIVADIAKMPHLLIAGATGAGKSVCINTLIMSLIYKADPDKVRLIMIDPKVVELSVYNGIPHLLYDVVTDPKKAAGALNWAVAEMTRRYQLFAEFNVRDLAGYNEKVEIFNAENSKSKEDDLEVNSYSEELETDNEEPKKSNAVLNPLPQIVIIVDELADLMMIAPGEVEGAICRLAQLARAAGLHLIVATQRPSVNVITGLIKANMPSRIAFSVTSGVDSRTIIDMNGAEKLLGRGDMLFYPSGYPKPVRVQGSFVSDTEVHKIVEFLKKEADKVNENQEIVSNNESENIEDYLNGCATTEYPGSVTQTTENEDQKDAYFAEAGYLIIDKEKASIGMLQRRFKIGFNRAARIMDQLHEAGFVSGEEGTKPRNILMSKEEFERYLEENGIA